MPRKRRRRRVALLIESSNAYGRGLLRGIRAYVREHGDWSAFLFEHGRGDRPPRWLADWHGDGVIARIENRGVASAVRRSGLPVVDLSAARLVPAAPWVETDDDAIARLAFDHLHERGFRSFAYCGDARFNWSRWRRDGFVRRGEAALCPCAVLELPGDAAREPEAEQAAIVRWLRRLPRPVGIMACYDACGRRVIDAARAAGIAVPDEAAVVGVDNDELTCDLCDPPLSSVRPDTHRTGYTAARLLDRMMSGREVSDEGVRIEPLGVVTRQSTDVLAIDDAEVSAAIRFIREHATDPIAVQDVVDHVSLSRRVLESRFKRLIGRTPHGEITRLRIERVKQLLVETELPLSKIAARAGYRHVEYLSVAFRGQVGVPPSRYRQRRSPS